jgi:hypothetical protein
MATPIKAYDALQNSQSGHKPVVASDKQFAFSGSWALASDGLQWILQRRRHKDGVLSWRAVSFVRTRREVLARCMHEKGVPPEDARRLLSGLPRHFDDWCANRNAAGLSGFSSPGVARASSGRRHPDQPKEMVRGR